MAEKQPKGLSEKGYEKMFELTKQVGCSAFDFLIEKTQELGNKMGGLNLKNKAIGLALLLSFSANLVASELNKIDVSDLDLSDGGKPSLGEQIDTDPVDTKANDNFKDKITENKIVIKNILDVKQGQKNYEVLQFDLNELSEAFGERFMTECQNTLGGCTAGELTRAIEIFIKEIINKEALKTDERPVGGFQNGSPVPESAKPIGKDDIAKSWGDDKKDKRIDALYRSFVSAKNAILNLRNPKITTPVSNPVSPPVINSGTQSSQAPTGVARPPVLADNTPPEFIMPSDPGYTASPPPGYMPGMPQMGGVIPGVIPIGAVVNGHKIVGYGDGTRGCFDGRYRAIHYKTPNVVMCISEKDLLRIPNERLR